MLLVLCVDLDDDLGRKTGWSTPVIGRDNVERAAVDLATADPEDSDVNVLFEGVHLADRIDDEAVEVAVVTGTAKGDVSANRKVGEEVDTVLASISTSEDVRALVVTDGAQDESVIPVIRSRVPIDGVRRVVVRQAQDLESMYYTFKQVLDDPETRGTILIPLGILLLIYPAIIVGNYFDLPGASIGVVSGLFGLYLLFRGFGLERVFDRAFERARTSLFTGRVTIVTSVVAAALILIGVAGGLDALEAFGGEDLLLAEQASAFAFGAITWFAAAGITASLGRVIDEYLHDAFRWRYLNAPVYVSAIALVLHGVSVYFLEQQGLLGLDGLQYLATTLTVGTLLGLASTLAFAIAESRFPREPRTAA